MKVTEKQLQLLWHTLGLRPDQIEPYRNFFDADPNHHDMPDLQVLECLGFMARSKTPAFVREGAIFFFVTEAGKRLAVDNLPKPKKRSQYQEFLDADYGHSFAEFLGIDVPICEYDMGQYRFVRTRRTYWHLEVIYGEWCKTKKEAKASYKSALKAHKDRQKELNLQYEAAKNV